jgi:hypothetical protein
VPEDLSIETVILFSKVVGIGVESGPAVVESKDEEMTVSGFAVAVEDIVTVIISVDVAGSVFAVDEIVVVPPFLVVVV